MFSPVTVSAPGKIHLMGEHAAVYGRPAFLAAVDRRVFVSIRPRVSRGKRPSSPHIFGSDDPAYIRRVLSHCARAFGLSSLPPVSVSVKSFLPPGAGLGSSAAVAAAVIGAMMKGAKNLWNPQRINELTYEEEKITHKNPSGADNTAVVFGGIIWFRREFAFLTSLWSLPVDTYPLTHFLLVFSGIPRESTGALVSRVSRTYVRDRESYERIFSDQEYQTKRLLLSVRSQHTDTILSSLRAGERNLESIGVVGARAQAFLRDLEQAGGAGKICGAGGVRAGSGMLLCYHRVPKQVFALATRHAFSIFPVRLAGDGVRIETADFDRLPNAPDASENFSD